MDFVQGGPLFQACYWLNNTASAKAADHSVDVVLVDFSKAFEKVRLLEKLWALSV